MDYYVTEDERCSADEDEQRSGEQATESDVNENEMVPRPATSRNVTSPLNEPTSGTTSENDVTNDLKNTEIA